MPEGPEVTILSQYLLTKLQNRTLEKMDILSGKYTRNPMRNYELLDGKVIYTIKDIQSKGKLMWFVLESQKDKTPLYITSHLGLTGFWSFAESANDRLMLTIHNETGSKTHHLYFEDIRNFGNIEIYTNIALLNKKVNELAPDALREDYTVSEFVEWVEGYTNKTVKRAKQNIALVLMKQKKNDGILSGIGNYLMAEILYHAKISPFRAIGSLTPQEITRLGEAIQYIVKLSYYNNTTGYMTHFDDFTQVHKERIDRGIYPDYHPHIKLDAKDKFTFKVYRQKTDPFGNPVQADKSIQKTRSTYWSPNVQH